MKAQEAGTTAQTPKTMAMPRVDRVCGPETPKMLMQIFEDVARIALAERVACHSSGELAMRLRLGEIILALHAEGEGDPNALRRKALERILDMPKGG
jgi:ribosome-binding protein aMBF1 (putative translation factor)